MDTADIDCARAAELHAEGAAWIDVREPDEWAVRHIPGTELLPLQQAAATVLTRFPDLDAPIVVSCASGARSGHLVAAMRDAGYTQAFNLRGGILAWAGDGRPVVSGQ